MARRMKKTKTLFKKVGLTRGGGRGFREPTTLFAGDEPKGGGEVGAAGGAEEGTDAEGVGEEARAAGPFLYSTYSLVLRRRKP